MQYVTKVIEENGQKILLLTPDLLNHLDLQANEFLVWDLDSLTEGEIRIQIQARKKKK